MSQKRKSLKNGNKALQGFLGLIILVGAVLGVTAFILHFTNKGGCGEGYEDGTDPSPAKCKEASDQGLFDGPVACCGNGTCDLGSICGWARPSKNFDACEQDCANNMCASGNCVGWKCVPKYWKGKEGDFCNNSDQCASENCSDGTCTGKPKVCVGEENEKCDDDRECLSLYCLDNKCTGPKQCKSSNICPDGQKCNANKGRGMDGNGQCGPPDPDSTIPQGDGCELSTGFPCRDGYCEWNANVGVCTSWWDLCNSPT
jgi:hypothetical protein